MSDLIELRDMMRDFTAERDWNRFHDPKSLILALVGEVGELAELFQWLPAAEAPQMGSADGLQVRASEEIADVLLYLVRLSDVLGIDVFEAAVRKMSLNREKHPSP